MDSLTHGLLGLAIGALFLPRESGAASPSPSGGAGRAVLLGAVLAAELPDLDYLLPASDEVLHALRAHRGLSHSLAFAPLVALAAAGVATLAARGSRFSRVYAACLASVLLGHLLADAWTGWGTRLLLPWSESRVTLDWMMVVDPLFTLPLLVTAVWAFRRRPALKRALVIGLAVASTYLAFRVAAQSVLTARVGERYPHAVSVHVFPSWLGPTSWRYVAVLPGEHAAGAAPLFGDPVEQARRPRPNTTELRPELLASATVREALAWARFPLLELAPRAGGGSELGVADLRYHLNGAPTLRFAIELDARGDVVAARLDRGGSARSLLERFRGR